MITGTEQIGILKTNNPNNQNLQINIRSGPSLSNNVKLTKPSGTRVTILEKSQPAGDSYSWYRVRYADGNNDTGWVREDVINVLANPNPSPSDTRLLFETQTRQVRVYGREQPYMNIYVKATNSTDLLRVTAVRIPKSDDYQPWISYIAIKGTTVYQVRFISVTQTRSGQAELIIGESNSGQIYLQEKGFGIQGYEYNQL
ncbi:SH3 domain-containing protein [Calothrix membranacea FACHB-236]|nr:SH3 domain-containing protein [Calothrix membranacea FACHB-236]